MPEPPKKTARQYRKQFARKVPPTRGGGPESTGGGLESTGPTKAELLKDSEVIERLGYSRESLHKMIESYLGNDPELKKIADEIVKDAEEPMRAIAGEDDDYLEKNPTRTKYLEVIVQTDGSRPSFLIEKGHIDTNSSPLGDWSGRLAASGNELKKAIACTGRINIGMRHIGTGFLISPDLIVTNRHVLQDVAKKMDDGSWRFHPSANIDFGHELKGDATLNRRKLVKLVYTGKDFIDVFKLDPNKLDLALVELSPAVEGGVPPANEIMQWNKSDILTWADTDIYIIGYPGPPPEGIPDYTSQLLDKLFKSTYGCKRLAPGRIMETDIANPDWVMDHDATTLGGNSGSLIVAADSEYCAAGLHYGGDTEVPRKNWGHILGKVMDWKGENGKELVEFLDADRIVEA